MLCDFLPSELGNDEVQYMIKPHSIITKPLELISRRTCFGQ